ncbi:PIN domain-containing protein [Thermoanaerobacterium thermosaccharolyticum]|uniref:PIN domain-containing protein n=1 Tax=Thermoanaerobacterium thermosaccharolyticum TaxID=1517 RepID=UPI003DA81BC9
MNVLIDTNVMLDAMLSHSPFAEDAQKLFITAAEEKINVHITASSITDIYYLLHKYLHGKKRCKQEIYKIIKIFNIIDVTGSDCEKALKLPMEDYEDALLAACAKRRKMECIITRDIKDFVNSPVRAVLPGDFLKSI